MMEEKPNAARMYDYFLGGNHNTEVDRKAGDAVLDLMPVLRYSLRANRQVSQRFTYHMVTEYGLNQILDLGSGLPTMGNVHEIALKYNPQCKVVYVDHDESVVHYAQRLLNEANLSDKVTSLWGDLRDMDGIFNHPQTKKFIDFSQPVGILASSVLHFLDDQATESAINYIYDHIVKGSYFGVTHGVTDGRAEVVDQASKIFAQSTTPGYQRTSKEVEAFFSKFQVLPPGFVDAPEWQPDPEQPPIGGVFTFFGICSGMMKVE